MTQQPNTPVQDYKKIEPGKPQPGSRESNMITLEHDATGKPTVWCDPEIAPLVKALIDAGIRTVASCSGHGKRNGNIALADGRELIIARDYRDARNIERLINIPTPNTPQPAEELEKILALTFANLMIGKGYPNVGQLVKAAMLVFFAWHKAEIKKAALASGIETAEQIWGVYTARLRDDPNEPMFDFDRWLPGQIEDWKRQLAALTNQKKETL